MSNTEPEEKQSFMDKLKHPFRTHSRSSSSVKSGELDTSHLLFDHSNLASLSAHDKGVLESAYIEGQRHAEKKYNRKVSRYGFPVIGALGSGNQGSGSNYGSTTSKERTATTPIPKEPHTERLVLLPLLELL